MIALIPFAIPGCWGSGDGLAREPIAGSVTFDGQPLKSGSIQFMPTAAEGGVASGGVVSDGRFQVARANGPVPGKYSVLIVAARERGASRKAEETPGAPDAPEKRGVGLIPMKYNFQTELTAEVKAGGPNDFTFDLKK